MLSGINEEWEKMPVPGAKDVRRIKNVMIPVSDGIELAADLYIPAESTETDRFPVVMEYIPYRKDDVDLQMRRHYLYLPQNGYILARVDVRGTGMSGGISFDEYTRQEQNDGYDAVEWLATQPWCDGHVNMMGISYGGFTALQVAATTPEHLTSIIPVDFTDDRYTDDCHYRGGMMRMYYDVAYYGGFMIPWNAMPPHARRSNSNWAEIWEKHLTHNEPYILKWYENQTDGPYWRQGSVRDITDKIACPVFMIGGWRDGYTNPPLRLYQALKTPKKLLMGPWNHSMPDTAIPGPRIEHLREIVRWLDYWCRGKETGIMDEAPIVVYEQEYEPPVVDRLNSRGRWRAEKSWPPPGMSEKVYYFNDTTLTENPPDENAADVYPYITTVGITGGLYSSGIQFGLPGNQRPDEVYSLVYTSPPLETDVVLLGWPRVICHVASTASVMGFIVSLSEIGPDRKSHLIAKGTLNGTRRDSLTDPSPLTKGEIYELDIPIDCTCWRFSRGNRIRLAIASADWPNLWPTPLAGENTVYRGPDHPSRLILPIVPLTGSAEPPVFKPSPVMRQRHSASPHPPTWNVIEDILTGRKTVKLEFGSSHRLDPYTVLERSAKSEFVVYPDDPGQSAATGRHLLCIRQFHQVVEGRSDIAVLGTEGFFHITIDLEIRVNDSPHFNKRWVRSIPRNLL